MVLPATARRNVMLHLRAARQNRGIPLERVAHGLGRSVEIVDAIESGRTMPTAAELQRLCRWYGLDVRAVFHPRRMRLVSSITIGSRPIT